MSENDTVWLNLGGVLLDWANRLAQSAPVPVEVFQIHPSWEGPLTKVFASMKDAEKAHLIDETKISRVPVHGAPSPAEQGECERCDARLAEIDRLLGRAEKAEKERDRQNELAVHWLGLSRRYLRACKRMHREWKHEYTALQTASTRLLAADCRENDLKAERDAAVKRAEDMEEDRDRALSRLAETACPELGALRGTEVRLLRDERDALQAQVGRLNGEIESASDLLTQRGLAFATLPRQIVALADEADAANKRAEQIEQEYASVSAALRARVGDLEEVAAAIRNAVNPAKRIRLVVAIEDVRKIIDSPVPEETPKYLCEIRPTAKGAGVFLVKGDHPTPDDTALPPCPKCGRQINDFVAAAPPHCGCTYIDAPDAWRLFCEATTRELAENTPCWECGELPKWDTADDEFGPNLCGHHLACSFSAWLTPAEWLDRNKEVKDDESKTPEAMRERMRPAPGSAESGDLPGVPGQNNREVGGVGKRGEAGVTPDALERARKALRHIHTHGTHGFGAFAWAILDHLENERRMKGY